MPSSISSSIVPGMASSITQEKVRENRLRRMAERQGLRLTKSRRRDPRALDYGGYALVDETNGIVFGTEGVGRMVATLDEVEAYLTGDDDQ